MKRQEHKTITDFGWWKRLAERTDKELEWWHRFEKDVRGQGSDLKEIRQRQQPRRPD
ncbi:MAG: hypothetical protein QF613_07790 [Candidatus Marinimicrobia bacterium]|nr:hypothetical protein [Candidatus Neomarinimicrobiota bacterium]MDP6593405.1 hypothetical protein [Candidatus Neomarinimicrobiota bacterium]MDP6594085.1 hypothetical protein [Candidatus Neomarinimicrobiota bacterium]MDP6837159.1 hypothetical protein [Candidatus Neomarinimicrobiota bacterium]MDP6966110.1 hypothetical protein [Candidatus Neomarinimicrobiota bacterium]